MNALALAQGPEHWWGYYVLQGWKSGGGEQKRGSRREMCSDCGAERGGIGFDVQWSRNEMKVKAMSVGQA